MAVERGSVTMSSQSPLVIKIGVCGPSVLCRPSVHISAADRATQLPKALWPWCRSANSSAT